MQQSFGTQVVQSTLTDCAHKPNNEAAEGAHAPLQNIVVVSDAAGHADTVCNRLGVRCRLLSLFIYAPLLVLILVLFIWAFIAPSACLHFLLDISSSSSSSSRWDVDATLYSMHSDSYNLSVKQWVSTLWSNKSHAMAIAVVLWSLAIPILKLLFILALILCHAFKDNRLCLRMTPKWLAQHNASVFLVSDILSRYSFLNVFILLVLMTCLYVHIDHDISAAQFYAEDLFHLHSVLLLQSDRGIVLFGLAVFLTSLLSVVIRYQYLPMYAAHASSSNLNALDAMQQKLSLSDSNLLGSGDDDVHPSRSRSRTRSRDRRYSSEPLSPLLFSKNYSFRSFCVKMVSFAFFALMVVGAVAVMIGGVALIEVDYVGGESAMMSDPGWHRLYSINELVQSVDQANNTGATKFLRILYQLFGIIVPLITMVLLMLLWFIPMPLWLHHRIKQLIWNSHLLNAMDVIVIACVIVQQILPPLFDSAVRRQTPTVCKALLEYVSSSSFCDNIELDIYLRSGLWITIAFYVSLWIVVVYSVYFSVDSYSAKQLRKVKMKIKLKNMERQDRERGGQDNGGTLFHTIDENKTL